MDASKDLFQNSSLNNSITSTNTIDLANNTLAQANLLIFVENFTTSSPNFRTPSQQRYGLSRASWGAYIAQFWTKAAVVNNCVLIDNKLAIPEQLWSAILIRLHRSHPGQAAMMHASEYICWPFLNRQIVNVCEKCPECTLFGKNIKTSTAYNSAKPLPQLSAPNQEIQLDFAGPIIDDKKGKIYKLVAIDRLSKYPSVMLTKTTSAKKIVKFLRSYIRNHFFQLLPQLN